MATPAQTGGVIGLDQIHDAGHLVDGVAAQVRPGTVRGFSPSLQLQPQISLVRRHHLQPRRLAGQREIHFQSFANQSARTALAVLLVH